MANTNPNLELDQRILGDVYSSGETWDNLLVLCDDFGSRFSSLPEGKQAADYILEKFKQYGSTNATLEGYEFKGWIREPAQLTILSPVERDYPCISLPYCKPSDIEGKLVFVGDGTEADFDSVKSDIPGNIVMVTTRSPAGQRWMHRTEKYDRAALLGAAGFVWMQHVEGVGPETGGLGFNHDAVIPGVAVAKEYGAMLTRFQERSGEVRLRIRTRDRFVPSTAYNITCTVGGEPGEQPAVILGCHYDGHDIAQGAQDPVTGTVVVMEAVRVLSSIADQLDRPVRMVIYSNEEVGLFGSIEDVEIHKDELDGVRFMLNLDSAGAPGRRKGIVLHRWPDLEQQFADWGNEMAAEMPLGQSVSQFSDHFPYFLEGVPSGSMGDPGGVPTGRGYGHTMWDTVDKLNIGSLREATATVCRLALRIANADNWPTHRRSQEEIQLMLDNEPAFEQHRLAKALVEKFGEQILDWR